MKTTYKARLAAFCLLAACSAVIYSCGKPLDGIDVIVTTGALSKSPTLVQFVNSNSDSPTPIPTSIDVTIGGPDKALVQTEDGGSTTFKATNGHLAISLSRKANPTTTNPVVFTVSASPTGYVPVLKTFTITSDTAKLIVKLPLVEITRPGDGIAYVAQNLALTSGTSAASSTTITVPTRTDAPQSASLNIAASTQMKDASGAAVSATSLSYNIVHYGTGSAEANSAFPGGFMPTNVIGADDKIISQLAFYNAGTLSIRMTAGTTAVKSFSKPVNVTIEISKTLINPTTGRAVAIGDAIPIWSRDETTGQWKNEKSTGVIAESAGKFYVTFPITHLSDWGLMWSSPVANFIPNFIGPQVPFFQGYQINASIYNQVFMNLINPFGSFNVPSLTFPTGFGSIGLTLFSNFGDPTVPVFQSEVNPASQGTVNITVPTPTVEYIAADITLVGKCTSKQVVAYPSTWITVTDVTDVTDLTESPVYATDGKISTSFISGHTYKATTTYNGKTRTTAAFKVDKTTNLSINGTEGLTGTAVYDAVSGRLKVDATFTVGTCN